MISCSSVSNKENKTLTLLAITTFLSRSPLLPTLLGAGFLYSILSPTGLVSKLTDFLSSLSYIIVQRPLLVGITNCTHSTYPQSMLHFAIPRPDAPVIYKGAFPILTARPGCWSIYNTTSPERYRGISHTTRLCQIIVWGSMGLPDPCWCSQNLILNLFNIFPLVWWKKSKISQENRG